ncbi:MAG: LamG-like jellyroll fold domain-containing protein [Patescibacteria group bacterium]
MIQNSRNGFTLIELLLVIAISVVAVTTGFLYLGGYRSVQNLKLTANEMLSAIKNTQSLSKSQQDGKKWGIRFTNPTSSVSTGPTYSVFSGTSYAAGTVSRMYPLGRNISFTNPSSSSTIDLIFNALTGYAPNNQIISLVSGRGDGIVNDIVMNTLGQITSRFDTGLVGYWHFDEGTATTTYDASGYGNIGTLTNGPTWQTGTSCKAGGCLSFDGISNYVNSGNNVSDSIEGGGTISMWIYPNVLGGLISRSVGSNWLDERIALNFYNTSGKIDLTLSNGSGYWRHIGNSVISTGVWIYVVVTWDGSNVKHYLNGVLDQTQAQGGVPEVTGVKTWIGAVEGLSPNYFNGQIDEVRIYNRALSATEVADIYNSTR